MVVIRPACGWRRPQRNARGGGVWLLIAFAASVVPALPVSAGTLGPPKESVGIESSAELTLGRAVELAVARAPLVRARLAGIQAQQEDLGGVGALPDPELTLGIDNLPITGPDAFDVSSDEMTQKRIGLRQVVPARAKREAARLLATRRVQEAVARGTTETLEVRRAAAEAWVSAWAADRKLQLLAALRGEAALASRAAAARTRTGAQSPVEALATQAAVADVDERIAGVEADRDAARAELARWTGRDDTPAAIEPREFDVLPVPVEQLLASVARLAPMQEAVARVESASAVVGVATAEARPDWSVSAAYGQRDEGRSDMLMVEVGIGLPLFNRNRRAHGVAAGRAEYEASVLEQEDLSRKLAAQIHADAALWEGLKRQVKIQVTSLIPLARDRSAVALASYRAGGELQPWLDARRDELLARTAYAERLGELGRAWVALAFLLPEEAAQ